MSLETWNLAKFPPFFTYICTFGFGFGIRPKTRCFSDFGFGFGLKWKTHFRSFTVKFRFISNTFRTKFYKSSHCELRERLENHACARHFIQLRFQCSAISWLPEGFSFRTKQAWKLRLILREGESYWKWSLSSYFQRVTYDETRMHIATESKQVCM